MKVDRDVLAQHLERIACNGQIKGAVFSGAFRTAAISEDQLLMVLAPELEDVTPVGDDLGIPSLALLLNALRVIGPEGEEGAQVEMRVEDHRLVIDEGGRGVLRLITAAKKTIGSYVDPKIVKALEEKAPGEDAPSVALTPQLLSAVRDTFALFKAGEVELFLGPDGGRIRVGNEKSNVAEIASAELRAPTEYSLLFGEHFVDVLRTVSGDGSARLLLGSPAAPSCVVDGGYRYLLGPRSRGTDES